MKEIDIQEILVDLKNGLTRLKKDDRGKGSIQEKYDLATSEVKDLFMLPQLKSKKTHTVGIGISFTVKDSALDLEISSVEQIINDGIVEEISESMLLVKTQEEIAKIVSE